MTLFDSFLVTVVLHFLDCVVLHVCYVNMCLQYVCMQFMNYLYEILVYQPK